MPEGNQDPNNGGNQDPNAGGQGSGQGVVDWKTGLDPSIKDHPCLANFKDVKDVVKSYVSVQPLIGKEKIPIPGEKATKEDWDVVFSRLGRPSEESGYKLPEIKLPEGFPPVQEEKLNLFRKKALELNLLPHQAAGLMEWYYGDLGNDFKQYVETRERSRTESEAGLRKEWGKAFDAKVSLAKKVVGQFGDKNVAEMMNDADLGNNPVLIRFLANIGAKMSEDGFFTGKSEVTMTPEEASAEIKKIQGDPKHPYFNKMHPEHELAVQRMANLFELAYPEKA